MRRTHLRPPLRAHLLLAAAAAAAAAPCLPAHAAATSWLAPTTGNWTDKTRWSTGAVPASADDVRIDSPGTYTVYYNGTRTVRTVTLDAPDATLRFNAFGYLNLSDLTLSRGTLLIDYSGGGVGPRVYTDPAPTLTNHATIEYRNATSSFTATAATFNDGTIRITDSQPISFPVPAIKFVGPFTNAGSLATGIWTRIEVESDTFEQNAGSIAGDVRYTGPTFNFNGGTVDRVTLTSATLNVSPAAGTGAFVFSGSGNTLAGTPLAPGSFISLTGGGNVASTLTLPASYPNNGRVLLGHDPTRAPTNGTLSFIPVIHLGPGGTGTLTNNGTLEVNSSVNYAATLNGQVVNNGSAVIHRPSAVLPNDYDTTLNGSWTNNGNVAIDPSTEGSSLAVRLSPGSSFTQNAGNLTIGAYSYLELRNAAFNYNGGTVTGGVALHSSSLNLTPDSGGGSFTLFADSGVPCSLTGDVPAAATVRLTAPGAFPRRITTLSFTNAGTLLSYNSYPGLDVRLDGGAGTLTNTGTLDGDGSSAPAGSSFLVTGSLRNTGTIRSSSLRVSGGTLTQDAGAITVAGSLTVTSGTFQYNGGSITGNPVSLFDSTLRLAPGTPAAPFQFTGPTGALAGDVPSGGTIGLAPVSTVAHQTVTAAAPFTNAGTITLNPRSTLAVTAPFANPGHVAVAADAALVIDYAGGASPAADVRDQLLASRLAPLATDATHRLAYLDSGSALTVTLALAGDANLDGRIDADDYALVDRASAKSMTDAHWTDGDFNYDGTVDQYDYLLLDTTLGKAQGFSPGFLSQRESQFGPAYVSDLLATVPEPSSLACLFPAILPLCTRRRHS